MPLACADGQGITLPLAQPAEEQQSLNSPSPCSPFPSGPPRCHVLLTAVAAVSGAEHMPVAVSVLRGTLGSFQLLSLVHVLGLRETGV